VRSCPFAPGNPDEDALADAAFAATAAPGWHSELGFYRGAFAGHVIDEAARRRSASGGLMTWVLRALLADGIIDAAACVLPSASGAPLFRFALCRSADEAAAGSGSAYYPAELSDVVREIRASGERVAITCLPCQAKALRLAMNRDAGLRDSVKLLLGVVCGHGATPGFSRYGAELAGAPTDFHSVRFRAKDGRRPVADWGVEYRWTAVDGSARTATTSFRDGLDEAWTNHWFTPRPCFFCDDVFAEAADACFMDAWLPAYAADRLGTSLVIVRAALVADLLELGDAAGKLSLRAATTAEVTASQQGVIAFKRQALAHRLWRSSDDGDPVPRKRVTARRQPPGVTSVLWDRQMSLARQAERLWPRRESLSAFQAAMRLRSQTERAAYVTLGRTAALRHGASTAAAAARRHLPARTAPVGRGLRQCGARRALPNHPLTILLVGHSGFYNRGCEALVRTTSALLRERFGADTAIVLASGHHDEDAGHPAAAGLRVIPANDPHWSWLLSYRARRLRGPLDTRALWRFDTAAVLAAAREADVVISIGGDNFTLDYGYPSYFLELNEMARRLGKPLVIWGASIGPFDDPLKRTAILRNLRRADLLTVRDPLTLKYLRAHGFTDNLRPVADPAFLLDERPFDLEPLLGSGKPIVGINIGPLIAHKIGEGGRDAVVAAGAALVRHITDDVGVRALLVPHVMNTAVPDDHDYLDEIMAAADRSDDAGLLPDTLDACELKYAISRCDALVAARTHATIAGYSSGVPTLALGYSLKARGLALDTLGDLRHVLQPAECARPDILVAAFDRLWDERAALRRTLKARVPHLQARARDGADYVARLLEL